MLRTSRLRIAVLVGAIAAAIAIPAAQAQTADRQPEQALGDIAALLEGLADHLDDAGIDHEIVELPVVVWDVGDEAANDAVADYLAGAELPFLDDLLDGFDLEGGFPFADGFPFEGEWFDFDGEFPGVGLPEELVADLNAAADELAVFLDERGVGYEVVEGPMGVRMVIPDLSDPAVREALEEFHETHGGFVGEIAPGGEFPFHGEWFDFDLEGGLPFLEDLLDGFDLEGGFPFGDGFPFEGEWFDFDGEFPGVGLPEELVADLNAAADELAVFLDERGVGYEVVEGPMGVRMVIPDLSDPAVREALEEFHETHGDEHFGRVFEFEFPGGRFGNDGPCPLGGLLEEIFGAPGRSA